MPLVRAIDAVQQQCDHAGLGRTWAAVRASVQAGNSLADSLAEHPDTFDRLYVRLVDVGEAIGYIGPVLERVADHLERSTELRRRVRLAMLYPAMILAVAAGAVGFMLTVIVPTFSDMFAGFNASLPAATQTLIDASSWMQANGLWLVLGLAGGAASFRYGLTTERGRRLRDRASLHLPVLSDLVRKHLAARFCRTLGTLLQHGVALSPGLQLLTRATEHRVARDELRALLHAVESGATLASGLTAARAFPPLVQQMILVGEETAQLDDTLLHVAEAYERELESTVDTLTALVEPILILVIGVTLGGILIALYLPLFEMSTVIGSP